MKYECARKIGIKAWIWIDMDFKVIVIMINIIYLLFRSLIDLLHLDRPSVEEVDSFELLIHEAGHCWGFDGQLHDIAGLAFEPLRTLERRLLAVPGNWPLDEIEFHHFRSRLSQTGRNGVLFCAQSSVSKK